MKRKLGIRAAALLLAVLMAAAGCAAAENTENDEGAVYMFEDAIPTGYYVPVKEGAGRIDMISYPSKDYSADGADVEKPALVYVPAGYEEGTPCDVLVLCHGVGGNEYEWGFGSSNSRIKNVTDHLFAEGFVKNLIIVMPNGRSSVNYANTDFSNMQTFYAFGQELRNDLLPYIDAHYSTYADREHRAMAGLSMGGMQTINIGLCECLDLFSAFGVFSAGKMTLDSARIPEKLQAFPEDCTVRCLYCLCGAWDDALDYSAAILNPLPDDPRLTAENCIWQRCGGGHNFKVWYLGLYNFLRILGSL